MTKPKWGRNVNLVLLAALGVLLMFAFWYNSSKSTFGTVSAESGPYRIQIALAESTAQTLRENAVTLSIQSKEDDRPIDGAHVTVSLLMPRMFCGVVRTELQDHGDGTYTGNLIPLMSGKWLAEATVEYDGNSYKASQPFHAVQ